MKAICKECGREFNAPNYLREFCGVRCSGIATGRKAHAMLEERNRDIIDAVHRGEPVVSVAQRFGITKQRVYGIIKEHA